MFHLKHSGLQCQYSRSGLLCGGCPPGLNQVAGKLLIFEVLTCISFILLAGIGMILTLQKSQIDGRSRKQLDLTLVLRGIVFILSLHSGYYHPIQSVCSSICIKGGIGGGLIII